MARKGRSNRPRPRIRHWPVVAVLLVSLLSTGPVTEALEQPLKAEDPLTGETVLLPGDAVATHLFFFATWCQPCIDEFPMLIDLEARWASEGYVLYLVAVPTRQDPERLERFMEENNNPGRILFDAAGGLARSLGVERMPRHVLINQEGEVVFSATTFREGVAEEVERLVGSH